MNSPTLTFIDNGFSYVARLVRTGDYYGRKLNRLHEDKPVIEFYDGDQDKPSHGPYGQLISRYYVETMMEPSANGLDLAGGVLKWNITAESVDLVQKWLHEQTHLSSV